MIALRPAGAADDAFLRRVYATTRADELAMVPWSDEQKAAFVDQQFRAQDIDYRRRFPHASFLVIEADGEPVGRLYTVVLEDQLLVLDIAVLPEWRGRHVGSQMLEDVIAEADRIGVPTALHVERWNAARRLYDRLGFTVTGGDEVYLLMERLPQFAVS
jgi:ribosomal protein S18 acetylase RimI-like enzyme